MTKPLTPSQLLLARVVLALIVTFTIAGLLWYVFSVDARTGRSPFLWGAITDPAKRCARFDAALVATSRIILLGLVMDTIYQALVFEQFFPGEAVIFALALAFVPPARGLQGRRQDPQGPPRRLRHAALPDGRDEGEPAAVVLLHQRRRRHHGNSQGRLEERD